MLSAVSLAVLSFLGCIERGAGQFINIQGLEGMNEGSDIYDLEPWDPSASTPWSFLFSSFTPEPCYWKITLPWGNPVHATCSMTREHGNGNVHGEITLDQVGTNLRIGGMLFGLMPGHHGFHIHAFGDLGNDCKAAGGHFNPTGNKHGGPTDEERHAGDLGNVHADAAGEVELSIMDSIAKLGGPPSESILGRAIVIHEGEDDLGRGGDAGSEATGNAGARAGCCLITTA